MTLPLFFFAVFACTSPQRAEQVREQETAYQMGAHFDNGRAVRDAVIAGDLEAAQRAGRAIVDRLPVTTLPKEADPLQADLEASAQKIADAPSIDAAARAVGEMAVTCGTCHDELDKHPELPSIETHAHGDGLNDEMKRHMVATELLWRGLVVPDPNAFGEATATLAKAPLVPSGVSAASPLPPLATELEVQVHDLAESAARLENTPSRGRLYGDLLATCASCHALAGRGPASPSAPSKDTP